MAERQPHLAAFCPRTVSGALFAAAALLVGSAPALAQGGASYRGTPEQQQACTDDVFRLCNQFVPDEPRIIACLQANRRQLSPLCRQVFQDPDAKSGRRPAR